MKRIKLLLASLWLALPLLLTGMAYAAIDTSSPQAAACTGSNGTWDAAAKTCTSAAGNKDVSGILVAVTKTLIFIVGAIAVIMIIVGGLRYVLSGGDSAGVKGAKDTILYALVGVIVAIIAYAAVDFVITRVG